MSRWLLALCFVGMAWSTRADAEPDAAKKKHAGELAAESSQHYKRGEFEISVALLRQAYALYPEPNLLYNLGRSLEGLGDAKGAIEAYESYLAAGKSIEDRGAIERRVTTLKAEVAEKARLAEPKPPPKPLPPPVVKPPVVAPHVEPPPRIDRTPNPQGPSILPWFPITAGVAVLAGGGGLAFLASDRHDQAVHATVGTDAQGLQDQANRFATIANVMFVAGGVALAGGLVWEIHERRKHGHRSGVAARARITPGGVSIEWTLP